MNPRNNFLSDVATFRKTNRLGNSRFKHDGCLAFFGYDDDFLYHTDVKDIFFECDTEIDLGAPNPSNSSLRRQQARRLLNR